jgi:NAD+ kinase
MTQLTHIGILAHPRRPESFGVAQDIAAQARTAGLEVWVEENWSEERIGLRLHDTQMLVVIGGDGAILQAARLGAPRSIPIFGINMGYLGFLTESRPENWADDLPRLLAGDYWIEKRLMITGEVWRAGQCIYAEDALNDVVISRGAVAKTVHLQAYINGEWATNYNADGVIVATATGSTAYALGAGGPILPPELDNLLMVPVAPHISMERPIILAQGAQVKIVVAPRTQTEVVVTIDGRNMIRLDNGDDVRVRASESRSYFVRLQGRNYFYRSLMDRMEPRFSPRFPDS